MAAMKEEITLETIRQYFPDFSEPELQDQILANGKMYRFPEGSLIMDFGSHVRMLPLIIEGSIKVSREGEDGSELFLYYLSRGESCTMTFSCCMSDKVSEIRAVAEEDTVILGLPQRVLDEWMMKYKSWKNFVLQSYDQRMKEMISTIDQIAFSQLDQRLLDYLSKTAELHQSKEIKATHLQIASDLNVSRESISRLLKNLESRGQINLGRNKIILLEDL
ncbi:MAG: Crp/Fnr family transcriptional regulator [Bacteroidota bacterium]